MKKVKTLKGVEPNFGDWKKQELITFTDGNNAYVSFGLSGDANTNQMVRGDVVAAWYDGTTPRALDLILTTKAQVRLWS